MKTRKELLSYGWTATSLGMIMLLTCIFMPKVSPDFLTSDDSPAGMIIFGGFILLVCGIYELRVGYTTPK